MSQYDLPLHELRAFRSELKPPDDFGDFWADTLRLAADHTADLLLHPASVGLTSVDVFDVRFPGWSDHPVAAWLYVPRGRQDPGPAIVEYIGYTGGRGLATDHLMWSALGYIHLVVDTRGQGSSAAGIGTTFDDAGPVGPHSPGFLTMGIESRESYYYRRLYVDAVRAVAAVRSHALVDPDRVVVSGISQGGGIALAVGGLVPGLAAVMPDVPFMCDIRRATELTDARPYFEIAQYCRAHRDSIEAAFMTLSYFDGTCFAAQASAPALFSVALMDEICPPSTVFAAYNAYAAERQIEIYPYNGHEGGGGFQRQAQVRFLEGLFGALTA